MKAKEKRFIELPLLMHTPTYTLQQVHYEFDVSQVMKALTALQDGHLR